MHLPVLKNSELINLYRDGILNPSSLYQPVNLYDHPYCPHLEGDWLRLLSDDFCMEYILGVKIVLIDYLIRNNKRPDLKRTEFDPNNTSIVYYKSGVKNWETTGINKVGDQIYVASPPFPVINERGDPVFIHWSKHSTLEQQVLEVQRSRGSFNCLYSLIVRNAGFILDDRQKVLNIMNQNLTII